VARLRQPPDQVRGLKPVKKKVAGPFGPNEKPTTFVMKVVPPEAPTR
jgi:hypothetical protein